MLEEHLGGHGNKTHLDEGSLRWFRELGFKSFLDVGCGPGGMVQLAEELGFDSFGIDGDYTLERYNPNKFLIHDFTKGPAPIDKTFDVCWSVEFVEHVYEEYIPNYVDAMKKCKNLVMSHAPEGHNGHHHVNCQNSPYWINTMEKYGFVLSREKTELLRKRTTMSLQKKKHQFLQKTGMFFENRSF